MPTTQAFKHDYLGVCEDTRRYICWARGAASQGAVRVALGLLMHIERGDQQRLQVLLGPRHTAALKRAFDAPDGLGPDAQRELIAALRTLAAQAGAEASLRVPGRAAGARDAVIAAACPVCATWRAATRLTLTCPTCGPVTDLAAETGFDAAP